jgi:2-polyprenyl-3-methyl-5-hydroxy-6-metoxy-1,4-benzoquinol methylase
MPQPPSARGRARSVGEFRVSDSLAAQQRRYCAGYRRISDDPNYRKIGAALLPLPAAKIRDVGCTNGALLEPFVRCGWSCSGFELCPGPAAKARQKGIDVSGG